MYQVSIVELSLLELIIGGSAWIGTNIISFIAALWVIRRAEARGDTRADGVVDHFDEKLESVEGRLNGQLESFEGRFSEAYAEDMKALPQAISTQVKMTGMSEKGVEVRSLQAYLDKEGVEVEEALEAAEGQFLQENPQALAAMALKKAYEADVSDKYRKENPLKAMLIDAGKAAILPQFEQAFLGTNQLPGRKKGNATNPYGL